MKKTKFFMAVGSLVLATAAFVAAKPAAKKASVSTGHAAVGSSFSGVTVVGGNFTTNATGGTIFLKTSGGSSSTIRTAANGGAKLYLL